MTDPMHTDSGLAAQHGLSRPPATATTARKRRRRRPLKRVGHGSPTALVGVGANPLRRGLTNWLRRDGIDVVMASDGYAVIERLSDALMDEPNGFRPDVLVVDAVMRGCTGMSLLAGLRNLGWDLPVVILAFDGEDEACDEAWKNGVTGVFRAPLDVGAIATFLRPIVARWPVRQTEE